MYNFLKKYKVYFIIKLLLLIYFSSDYQNKLFIPFVKHFISNFDNPYQYFYNHSLQVEFPYPPAMLYILSVFYLPYHLLRFDNILVQNLMFKIPTLLSDLLIVFLLLKIFPTKGKEIFYYYFMSPIIIYAAYMHSQLDLIPTAILFLSIYLMLKNKIILSAIVAGSTISTKFSAIAAIPLLCIYILKNYRIRDLLFFIIIPALVYLFFIFPFYGTGFKKLVLTHPKPMLLFNVFFPINNLRIYLPIFGVLILYSRFLAYSKINTDLLYSFLAIVFCTFVLLVPPSPGWYLWLFPFLSIFFIKFSQDSQANLYNYLPLNIVYLLFFVFFYIPDYKDLFFIREQIELKIYNERYMNIAYTLLETVLLSIIYFFYKNGIRSNEFYKKIFATVIGVGGDSGVGKTTLLGDISKMLGPKLLTLEGDADHKWERGDIRWKQITHLNPKANFLHNQADSLNYLKHGKPIYRRDYDHTSGTFSDPIKLIAKNFIAIGGLHPFFLPKMQKIIDVKIYLDPEQNLQRHWKILRDSKERGYSKNKVIEQLEDRKTDAEKFIKPQKNYADVILQYYTDKEFSIGDKDSNPSLKLKVTLHSNIRIEHLVDELQKQNISVFWDYTNDLYNQFLILENENFNKEVLEIIAKSVIPNIEEVLSEQPIWMDGYRGFVQLIVLLVISETMKVGENEI